MHVDLLAESFIGVGAGIALALAAVVILWTVLIYNGLIRKRMSVKGAWAQIDVQLKRRHDLIPNVVETVKGYAGHEKDTLERVIKARNQAVGASGVAATAASENMLTGALRQLFALSEAYPDLKANTNFQQLSEELASTENKISFARQTYNNCVGLYNEAIMVFPSVILANMFAFRAEEFYELDEPAARGAPKVSF
jgi:LemA protein